MVEYNPLTVKHTKEEAEYKVGYKCANCIHFMHPDKCNLVDGKISSEAVCKFWEMTENSKPYSKEFFMREAMKEHGK